MKILDNQLDKTSLAKLGEEACRLLIARDFQGLADKFGYALAYDQDEASAIAADFERSLSGRSFTSATVESVKVQNFKPNSTGLLLVVACDLVFDTGARVLVELIVAENGENKWLYLEEVSQAT